jgi:hypothetical protein
MSIFDTPSSRPASLNQAYPPGTPFRLWEAWIVGQTPSPTTGTVRTLAKVVAGPVHSDVQEAEYGVWGSLADQIRQLEPGELPAIVTLDNSDGLWHFRPHGPPEGLQAVPEAHLDPDPAPADEGASEPPQAPRKAPPMPSPPSAPPAAPLDLGTAEPAPPLPETVAPTGTPIDDQQAEPPPQLPPGAGPKGTDLDESQVFNPGGQSGR